MLQAAGAGARGIQGSRISLISKSEIRYEGVLYSVNPEQNTVALRNVKMFGTEGRKKDSPQIPPGDQIYEFIIFRGSDIKDLTVYDAIPPPEQQQNRNTPPDPAIVSAWTQQAPQQSLPQSGGDWQARQDRAPAWMGSQNQNQYRREPPRENRDNYSYRERDSYREQRDYPRQGRDQAARYRRPEWRGENNNVRGDSYSRQNYSSTRSRSGNGQRSGSRRRSSSYYDRKAYLNQHTGRNFVPNQDAPAAKEFSEDFNFEESNRALDMKQVAEEFMERQQMAPKYSHEGFFDQLSCEALDRRGIKDPRRLDPALREAQKKLDQETFGNTNIFERGQRRGFRGVR
eukprot:TRINITY_DN7460_c0_g1_i2.p1 TRINITY_DN7460_c0_g1~~TRINITY_DN7460_c0_g1_i2.p1  ORF type:complete len:343 (+),score=46.64 TRINITY_DN7460_c0_g1_i2:1003-2031(+)